MATLWHQREVQLPVLCSVRVNLQESGLTVNVRKVSKRKLGAEMREEGTEFDGDFLRADNLAHEYMAETDRQTVTLTPPTSGETSLLIKLPAGQYEFSTLKTGCKQGTEAPLTVPPATEPEKCKVDVEPPKCPS